MTRTARSEEEKERELEQSLYTTIFTVQLKIFHGDGPQVSVRTVCESVDGCQADERRLLTPRTRSQ